MQLVRRILPALAVALAIAAPSFGHAACVGDCGTDLATVPKNVEKYVKARWKSVLKCGKKANPICPAPCPQPDGTLDPYLLSASCSALIACNPSNRATNSALAPRCSSGCCSATNMTPSVPAQGGSLPCSIARSSVAACVNQWCCHARSA